MTSALWHWVLHVERGEMLMEHYIEMQWAYQGGWMIGLGRRRS